MANDVSRKSQLNSETLDNTSNDIGQIKGALGSVSIHEELSSTSLLKKLVVFGAIAGPGLIVMVGDNDAGGIATYAQSGQSYGTTLLWVVFLLIPVLMIAQEMVARLGAVTGIGHGKLIRERFGKWWALFSVIDLFILNFLTLMTEFIGVSLGFSYFGISGYISVPLSALFLMAIAVSGSFRRWERFLYFFIVLTLIEFPLMFIAKPRITPIAKGLFMPGVLGGWNTSAIMMLIGIIGTTVAPWQLFFQQSNVIDKRITPKWLVYERVDTFIGAILTNVAAIAIMVTTAFAFAHTKYFGNFSSALGVVNGLKHVLGKGAASMFAVLLIDAAFIGAAAVSLSSSYAYGDTFGLKHSLHRKVKEAKGFYISYTIQIGLAAGLVLIPQMPLGLVTFSVQILAGILLPSAIVFLLLLCNDKELLGPWVNALWLNILSGIIVFTLIILSLVITIDTIFPSFNAITIIMVCTILGILVSAGILIYSTLIVKKPGNTGSISANDQPKLNIRQKRQIQKELRAKWSMPSLALIKRPARTALFQVSMIFLRGYLAIAVVALIIKTVKTAMG